MDIAKHKKLYWRKILMNIIIDEHIDEHIDNYLHYICIAMLHCKSSDYDYCADLHLICCTCWINTIHVFVILTPVIMIVVQIFTNHVQCRSCCRITICM